MGSPTKAPLSLRRVTTSLFEALPLAPPTLPPRRATSGELAAPMPCRVRDSQSVSQLLWASSSHFESLEGPAPASLAVAAAAATSGGPSPGHLQRGGSAGSANIPGAGPPPKVLLAALSASLAAQQQQAAAQQPQRQAERSQFSAAPFACTACHAAFADASAFHAHCSSLEHAMAVVHSSLADGSGRSVSVLPSNSSTVQRPPAGSVWAPPAPTPSPFFQRACTMLPPTLPVPGNTLLGAQRNASVDLLTALSGSGQADAAAPQLRTTMSAPLQSAGSAGLPPPYPAAPMPLCLTSCCNQVSWGWEAGEGAVQQTDRSPAACLPPRLPRASWHSPSALPPTPFHTPPHLLPTSCPPPWQRRQTLPSPSTPPPQAIDPQLDLHTHQLLKQLRLLDGVERASGAHSKSARRMVGGLREVRRPDDIWLIAMPHCWTVGASPHGLSRDQPSAAMCGAGNCTPREPVKLSLGCAPRPIAHPFNHITNPFTALQSICSTQSFNRLAVHSLTRFCAGAQVCEERHRSGGGGGCGHSRDKPLRHPPGGAG